MRQILLTAGLLASLLALSYVLTGWILSEDLQTGLILAEVEGDVRVVSDEGSLVGALGHVLRSKDTVVTAKDSRAVLTLGQETHIRLAENSVIQVIAVRDDEVHLELEGGLISAIVRPTSAAVQITAGEQGVAATNAGFRFGKQDGVVGIELFEGDLFAKRLGDSGHLTAPTRVVVTSDGHTEIGAIPDDMVLNVAWPVQVAGRLGRLPERSFTGTTTPGARVLVTGGKQPVHTMADQYGVFSVKIELSQEGVSPITVQAVDVMGGVQQSSADWVLKTGVQRGALRVDYGRSTEY